MPNIIQKRSKDPFNGKLRQIHLDFHNSPFITDLAADFDAKELAKRFKAVDVNSVVVFSKCVHGMGYYPSNVVKQHPSLNGRDLTGEMIEALHYEGIRAPIYTIVGWEENLAQTRPEWMQMYKDGSFAQNTAASDGFSQEPGRYRWLNFLHPDYQDYFEGHLDELLERYPCDGFFIDMLVVHPRADWSDYAIKFREKHGLMGTDRLTHARFETAAQCAFASKFSRQIKARSKNISIFYNAENRLYTRSDIGVTRRARFQSHFEIESLPSGAWNYHHFPRVARNLRTRKKWLGMTGRFQRMWGDFGGIKLPAALEFECFRTQAMGGANSVGDQLHPRGTLDSGAYELIGGVFAQCKNAESFYVAAHSCAQVGIICPHDPETDEHLSTLVEEGLVALCQEYHYDCEIISESDDFQRFDVLVIGENTRLSEILKGRLTAYWKKGGKLFAAGDTPFLKSNSGWGPFEKLSTSGNSAFAPSYWRACVGGPLSERLGADERVIYERGVEILPTSSKTVKIWAERVHPYFQRSDLKFCSHFQAPPQKLSSGKPAIVSGRRWVAFGDPIFSEYRKFANLAVAKCFNAAMTYLIGAPRYGYGLKSTVRIYPLRAGNDLHLTLLHYLPERKALQADIISEKLGMGGQVLTVPGYHGEIQIWPGKQILKKSGIDSFVLPPCEGRLLLKAPAFFEHKSNEV